MELSKLPHVDLRICLLRKRRGSGQTNKREYGSGDMGGFQFGAISHIKLSQGAFRGNPPVSLIPPVSLLVGFPD